MTDLIVSTSDLTKVYGRHRVLERINLQMPSGAIYGFIGANGAGKTTTIRILLGLISASSGSATVLGHQRGSLPAKPIGGIAYLPDVPNLSPWLRGKDALITLAQLSDVPKDLAAGRANSLLDLVGLKGVQSKVGGYSRGMKQRLGIASALIGNPRLLVLDEPTSALDPMGRADVLAIIRALRGKASVLFSSHLLGDVQQVCTHVGLLDHGELLIQGELDDVLAGYNSKAVLRITGTTEEIKQTRKLLAASSSELDICLEAASLQDVYEHLVARRSL